MARGAPAIKQEGRDDVELNAKTNKRRRCVVSSACQPCRKRKSKCDGGLPVCATCTAVYKTPCFYDAESESRRSKTAAGTKRDSSVVSQTSSTTAQLNHNQNNPPPPPAPPNDNAEFLISSIRSLPEHEVYELIQQIRKDTRLDIAALAESWRKTVTFPPNPAFPSAEPHSLEGDLSMLLGKPAQSYSGESRYFGHTSGLSLITEDENYTKSKMGAAGLERKSVTWTTVTQDMAFVKRLLDLYFRWSHTFYVVFSREYFYRDFRSGREKYCSSLLVNAILAYACHYSDEPAARTDPDNFRTAGDHFFEEARRLLYEDENPSLTTTQALCVMAMREPSAGRDSSGFSYMGRCMRMAIELGLHLNNSAAPSIHLSPSEMEVRRVTFWGCFTVDTIWSICVGRVSQLPRAAITLDKPILNEPSAGLHADGPAGVVSEHRLNRMFLQEFSSLSELINDNNYMFFAPKERFTSRRLLGCYNKYQAWYRNLPQVLRLEGVAEPQSHIITLHMLYYTAVVHLFRPMLKVDLIHSDVRPRDTCIDAANKVSELLRLYRAHYSMRTCQLILTHVLLSVNIVHLIYAAKSQESYRNLVEGLEATVDMIECHYFGKRGFKVVRALSDRWNLPFPKELNDRKVMTKRGSYLNLGVLSPQADHSILPHSSSIASRLGGGAGYGSLTPSPPSSTQPMRHESQGMFAPTSNKRENTQIPSHPPPLPTSHAQSPGPVMIANHHPQPPQQSPLPQQRNQRHSISQSHIIPSYPSSATLTPRPAPQPPPTTQQQPPNPSPSAETLFWTPEPGIGVPILPRNNCQMSPMDLDSMLRNVDAWDRFGRDGFKMSDQWQQDPLPGQGGFGVGVGVSAGGNNGGGGFTGEGGQGNAFHAGQYGVGVGVGGGQQGQQGFDAAWCQWGGES
ncbi:hypothetical protein CC80DRAFT_404446 [Byssothecium circinans]|uniref:Zn(2)-C6 fungal-type domain-containing protein n=1 Tax=Byssothecium circinans TaxID=147558 RepID=A0A6A5U6L3_9PLEO|nr:hypothetical protein CC80DRAFT_404446 [Byssothecium circinans]